jgi:hypothetical protein
MNSGSWKAPGEELFGRLPDSFQVIRRQPMPWPTFTDKPLELNEVRDAVPVQPHQCGIDIVLEMNIPQPWRERFLQASIGSTRLPEAPYAGDWEKFLRKWESEMAHIERHRALRANVDSPS